MKWVDANQWYLNGENLMCGGHVVGYVGWNGSRVKGDPDTKNYVASFFLSSAHKYGKTADELKPYVEAHARRIIEAMWKDFD